MQDAASGPDALSRCLGAYDRVRAELSAGPVEFGSAEGCTGAIGPDGTPWLDERFYLPTGLAFGMPLPPDLERAALSLLDELLGRVGIGSQAGEVGVVRVPTGCLHVTLLSKSHYTQTDGVLSFIEPEEVRRAAEALRDLPSRPVEIRFRGLLVCPEGRVMIPGYPSDDTLFRIREAIRRALGERQYYTSRMAHMKLAHLVGHPAPEHVQALRDAVTDLHEVDLGQYRFPILRSTRAGDIPLTPPGEAAAGTDAEPAGE